MFQVDVQPDSIAIEHDGKALSYKALYKKSLVVYQYLKLHAADDKYIGLKIEQDFLSYAIIIGVWMSGKAYVPLNSHYPQTIIDNMLASLGICTVLSAESFKIFEKREDVQNEKDFIKGELAYVIHTSGSTGVPKAALITHENLNAFTDHYLKTSLYNFKSSDRFLQSYDLSFDVSLFCFSIPLMIGATLVLPKEKGVKYMTLISSILNDGITVCSNVPSVAKYAMPRIGEISMDSLRYCFFSGESLLGPWALAWMKAAKNAQVYNCYGPTETTIVCTSEHLNVLDATYFNSNEALPLGQPFENMILKLDDREILFKGQQVFKGYANDITDKINTGVDDYFCTGDLAELDDNGKLLFKGRKDEQVQINGYRVELSAIDKIVQKKFKRVSKSVMVTARNNTDYLVTTIEGSAMDLQKVKNYLVTCLPSYSLPTMILCIEELPLNHNGKLNIKALKNWCLNMLIEDKKN